MNFARPITPATTGPVSMPIRTWSGSPVSAAQRRHLGPHRERQLGDRLGVIVARERNPAGDHVGVADRLDLLDAVLGGERVPAREHPVEQRHELRRGQPLGRAA